MAQELKKIMTKKLPLFPNQLDPKIERIFYPLCEDLTDDRLDDLINQIDQFHVKVQSQLQKNEFIDISIAERISSILKKILLENYRDSSTKNRKLIIGSIRYFIKDHDAQSDFSSILGFDDDVNVLNYVLFEIGKSDLRLDI